MIGTLLILTLRKTIGYNNDGFQKEFPQIFH